LTFFKKYYLILKSENKDLLSPPRIKAYNGELHAL
jgi:hypothetical protein